MPSEVSKYNEADIMELNLTSEMDFAGTFISLYLSVKK
jgi:hypothetical protein